MLKMLNNQAVSNELMQLLHELQALVSLKSFGIAGGTCLAIRYGHRKSIDIDLFSPNLIGIDGMKQICIEIEKNVGKERILFIEMINDEFGDQFCFVRALIKTGDVHIKVEIMQNVPLLDSIGERNGIGMVTLRDLGLLKLTSLCSRQAKKDAYDLDLITDMDYPLEGLMAMLKEREARFDQPKHKWVFDLDDPVSPLKEPDLLLAFDENEHKAETSRPHHTNDSLDIIEPGKTLREARTSWRRKVKEYLRTNGFEAPPVKPVN